MVLPQSMQQFFSNEVQQDGAYQTRGFACWEGELSHAKTKFLELIPGIMYAYHDINMRSMDSCYRKSDPDDGFMQLNYCIEGSYAFQMNDGSHYCLGPGDLCLSDSRRDGDYTETHLPTGHYAGFCLVLNLRQAEQSLQEYLPHSDIDLGLIGSHLDRHQGLCLYRSVECARSVVSMAVRYQSEKRLRQYILLKVLELLLVLEEYADEDLMCRRSFTPATLEEHEIPDLVRQFGISETNLRDCFKSVYGFPVGAFVRRVRIHAAAKLLCDRPELSIGDVASMAGYDNQSKFTAAFRSVFECTPSQYRRRGTQSHTKVCDFFAIRLV